MKKIIEMFVRNRQKIIFVMLTVLVASFLCIYSGLNFHNITNQFAIVIVIILMLVFMIMSLLKLKDYIVMSSMLFILLSIFLWICIPGMAPDEPNHFGRAFEVSCGQMISKHVNGIGGDSMPAAILKYEDKNAEIDWNDMQEVLFANTALYSPVSYIPQAIGIKITRVFTNNVSKIFYGGKIAHAIFNFIICVAALRIIPFGRKIIFLIMTFPLSLQEMVSMSPDGMTISLSLLFVAIIMKIAYESKKVDKKEVAVLVILGIMIAMCKIVYVVLLMLVFMIPPEKFNTKKSARQFRIGIIGIAGVLNAIWLKISSTFLVEFNPGVNSAEQVKYIILHIGEYYNVCVRTVLDNFTIWVETMVGHSMGAMNIVINSSMWLMVIILFIYEVLDCYENDKEILAKDCWILIITFLAGIALIFTSLYVQWTPVANTMVDGIQGRYYIPILSVLAFFIVFMRQRAFNERGIRVKIEKKATYMYIVVLLYNGITLFDMMQYYIQNGIM